MSGQQVLGARAAIVASGLFGRLEPDTLDRMATETVSRRTGRGGFMFLQGDPGDRVYFLGAGRVSLVVVSEVGDEMVLDLLEPGAAFGEWSLVDDAPRMCGARAGADVVVHSLDRAAYLAVAAFDPAIQEGLLRYLALQARRLTSRACDFVFLDLAGRVAKALLELRVGDAWVRLPLTQTELARLVGGSRQSVNQILRSFERRGLIATVGGGFVIRDEDGLRRHAGLALARG